MKNKAEKIDQYFMERLEHFEQKPPQAVWNAVAARLGHQRKKGMVVLIIRIAAGMALLISLGIGYYFISRSENSADLPELSENTKAGPADNTAGEKPVVTQRQMIPSPAYRQDKTELPSSAATTFISQPAAGLDLPERLEPKSMEKLAADIPGMDYGSTSSAPALTRAEALALLLQDSDTTMETEDRKQKNWSLASEFAPLYSYRSVSSDVYESDLVDQLNESESGILAYAGGISVGFSTGKRLSIRTGMYYSRYGQEKNHIETFVYSNTEVTAIETARTTFMAVTNSTGVIYSNNPENGSFYKSDSYSLSPDVSTKDQITFTGVNGFNTMYPAMEQETDISVEQLFDYLEIPLTVKYKIIDRKLDFSFSGGLVTNFLVGNVVKLEQNGETIRFGKTDEINQINYLGTIGLGFEYPLVSGFAISLEPRLRYYLNPIDKSPNINVHPYSFGFFAGISYHF
jgi:hypothetical protein